MLDHWSDHYLNIPHSRTNCARLCEMVQREVFGRDVSIPTEIPSGVHEQNRELERLFWEYVRPASRDPRDGDVALMICGARLKHVGTCCRIGRHRYILHSVRSLNRSVRNRDIELHHYALGLHGWYEWK